MSRLSQFKAAPTKHESTGGSEKGLAGAAQALATEEALHRLADFFKILGDPTRIRILQALFVSELRVCDIAELLRIGRSAVSHQLAILRQANLVTYRRAGKGVSYRLSDAHVTQILDQGLAHTTE